MRPKTLLISAVAIGLLTGGWSGVALGAKDTAKSKAAARAALSQKLEVSIRRLEDQAAALDTKTFNAVQAIARLTSRIFGGSGGGKPRMKLIHVNDISGAYRLVWVKYWLNGKLLYQRGLGSTKAVKDQDILFDGFVQPGLFQIRAQLFYRGHGWGIFTYLKKYRFTVSGSFRFHAHEGMDTVIRIVADESGRGKTYRDRLAVRFLKKAKTKAARRR